MIRLRLNQSGESFACAGFVGALLVFIFFYATAPISDLDFWWHLKTGEIMVQSGGLLQSDPFTFTGDGVVSNREALILKGYWLWQLTAYGLYSLLGFNGIFLLNFLTITAMAGVVIFQMRRQRVGYFLAIVLITLGFYLMRASYELERPQVVSFLFATILLVLLARVRDGGQLGWSLPLLMMIWANLHGGFIVGDLILLCFAAGVVIEYRQDLPRMRQILLWVFAGISISLLNPNGGLAFAEIFTFHNSALMTGISEYQSTWIKFEDGDWFYAVLWLLIVLYGLGLWLSRCRLFWPEFVIALFLAYFSVTYQRNVGFFAVAMLPAIGFYLQQGSTRQSWHIAPKFKYTIVLFAASLLLWQTNESWQKSHKEGKISSLFSAESSQFILSSGLQGRMFNMYDFGGYLIWKLYPQHRVFIDGRGLDPDVYNDWRLMSAASLQDVGGRKEFEVLFDRYGIDYVVQPLNYRDTGRLTPLLKFLLIKSEWSPVYIDSQCYILLRNSEKNSAVFDRYRLEKRDFSNKMLAYLIAHCNDSPAEVTNHVALAEMLIFVGRYAEAAERLELISRMQPDNFNLPSLQNQLAVLKYGTKH